MSQVSSLAESVCPGPRDAKGGSLVLSVRLLCAPHVLFFYVLTWRYIVESYQGSVFALLIESIFAMGHCVAHSSSH